MPSTKNRDGKNRIHHPIRVVRDFYTRCGFRQLSTAAGFSQMIGCSDSLIRNTESGILPFSEKLAHRIEDATGVSATWLLETDAKWRRGEDVSKARILGTEGKPWYPSRESKFHFTDQLLDVAGLLCERFPDYLPAFMGAMMEAFLEVERPPTVGRHSSLTEKRNMRKYLDTYLLPFLRLVGEFEGDARERFFKAFTARLEERDVATSSKMLDLWYLMHARDNHTSPPSTVMVEESRVALPGDTKRRGGAKRGKVK